MRELGLVVVGAVLGALLALVGNRLEARRQERKQRREALERLENMLSSVRAAVAHGHNFSNKNDWYRELSDLARDDRKWLDDLFEPTKRIAWRIRDQSFDHNKADAEVYCCDELLVDLTLLQLSLLPTAPMDRARREARARELAEQFLTNRWGILPSQKADELVDKFLDEWRRHELELAPKYVMSSHLAGQR